MSKKIQSLIYSPQTLLSSERVSWGTWLQSNGHCLHTLVVTVIWSLLSVSFGHCCHWSNGHHKHHTVILTTNTVSDRVLHDPFEQGLVPVVSHQSRCWRIRLNFKQIFSSSSTLLFKCTAHSVQYRAHNVCGAHFTEILCIAMHLKCSALSGKVAHFENCIVKVRSCRRGLRATALEMSLTVIRPC